MYQLPNEATTLTNPEWKKKKEAKGHNQWDEVWKPESEKEEKSEGKEKKTINPPSFLSVLWKLDRDEDVEKSEEFQMQ